MKKSKLVELVREVIKESMETHPALKAGDKIDITIDNLFYYIQTLTLNGERVHFSDLNLAFRDLEKENGKPQYSIPRLTTRKNPDALKDIKQALAPYGIELNYKVVVPDAFK